MGRSPQGVVGWGAALGSRPQHRLHCPGCRAGAEGGLPPFRATMQSQPASFGPLVLTYYFDRPYELQLPAALKRSAFPETGLQATKGLRWICSSQYPKDSISHAQPMSQGLPLVHPFWSSISITSTTGHCQAPTPQQTLPTVLAALPWLSPSPWLLPSFSPCRPPVALPLPSAATTSRAASSPSS